MEGQEFNLNDIIKEQQVGEVTDTIAIDPIVNSEINTPEQTSSTDTIIGREGQPQLTKDALEKDQSTPGASMGNLQSFAEGLDAEVEEAMAERELYEKQNKLREAEEKNREAMENQFSDIETVSEEDSVEEVKEDMSFLNSLRIKKVKDDKKSKLFGEVLKNKKAKAYTTKVALPNSGYTASLAGLSSPEQRNYSDTLSNLDRYGAMEYKYRTVHEKMLQTSIGDMDFDTFLKRTALLEFEVLFYGIFSSTFPEKSKYPFTCPKCSGKSEFVYYNKQYLDTHENDSEKRKRVLSSMRQVLTGEAIDAKELYENSETNGRYRKFLKNSKIVVELRHPTLYDQLNDVIKNATDQLIESNEALINLMPFITNVYFPVNEDGEESEYIALDSIEDKMNALNIIDDEDDDALTEAIEKLILSKYTINFTLRPPKCPLCGHTPDAEPVNFESMLFMTRQIRAVMKHS